MLSPPATSTTATNEQRHGQRRRSMRRETQPDLLKGRVCDDGSHQRKQEVCSGEQRNCAPAWQINEGERARVNWLEAGSCGIEGGSNTNATLPHNTSNREQLSIVISYLFPSFLVMYHQYVASKDIRGRSRTGQTECAWEEHTHGEHACSASEGRATLSISRP